MMSLDDKESGRYYKVAVLVANEPDCRNQIYTEKEIKQLFTTEANSTKFDIYHKENKIDGVRVIANYINKYSEDVASVEVPGGSWIKVLHVVNEDVIEDIDNGVINGVSTTLKADKESKYCTCNQNLPIGEILYSDVENKECFLTSWLSFVEKGCNNIPIEKYDSYESYIENNNLKVDNMEENKSVLDTVKEAFSEGIKLGKEAVIPADEESNVNNNNLEENPLTLGQIKDVIKTEVPKIVKESLVKNSETIVKESDSIEPEKGLIEEAVAEEYFEDVDDYDIYVDLMTEDCVIVKNYAEDKLYKVDYEVDGEDVTVENLVEVELQYVEVGATDSEDDESDSTDEEEVDDSVDEEEDDSKVKNYDDRIEALHKQIDELKTNNGSQVNNSGKKPLPSIRESLKDVPQSQVNNEDNNKNKNPTDSFGRPAIDYRDLK